VIDAASRRSGALPEPAGPSEPGAEPGSAPGPEPGSAPGEIGGARVLPRGRTETLALLAVLLLAAGLRLWGLLHDLPFSYYGDELHFMKRAMALGTGDLNPHWFHKPAFLMYVLAFCYGLYYALGALAGRFESTAELGAHFLFAPADFLLIGRLVVCACGIATVWVVYRLARRAYGSPAAGLAGALAAAVLRPMVESSQEIKSDIPCAFLVALSVLFYVQAHDREALVGEGRRSKRDLIIAGLLAGAAMGTHYYAIVLLPTYLLLEGWRLARAAGRRVIPAERGAGKSAMGRAVLLTVLFVAGFALTSPFNLLDPTWPTATWGMVEKALGVGAGAGTEPVARYDPDSKVEFESGLQSMPGAAVHFFALLASSKALGPAFTLLAALGLAAALARRATRWYGWLIAIPFLFFVLGAVTIAAYHAQPRHLNVVYALLATLVGPGAALLIRPLRALRQSPRRQAAAVLLVVGLASLPALWATVQHNRQVTRLDSRLVSYRWLLRTVRPGERLLLDDYGPPLNPNPTAAARMAAVLATLPRGPFTYHQGLRLDLVRRYPPPDGLDVTELGHQWWLPREKTDAELRSNPVDLDMSNPIVSRVPKSLAEYRRDGIRWVVTNEAARLRYFKNLKRGRNFPSFIRFYRELAAMPPARVFDPKEWGGKGPVVRVYDLRREPRTASPPR
jgi:Dolichyl-phosphate-mannose-protein mannosyltransferase